jgi:thiol-disulfide isomerase/thioredoxin
MKSNILNKYWLLVFIMTLPVSGKAGSSQEQTVITGKLSGAGGSAMPKAHVHLTRPNQSKPLTSIEVARDGTFKLATSEAGLLFVQFTGVNHLNQEVPLYVEKPTEVRLDVQLKPYEYLSDFSRVKIIGDFNDFSSQSAKPMQKQPDGTYAAEFETSAQKFAYQLLGVTKSGNSINGTRSEEYVYDGGGDYRSVVTPKNGRVRVVFDPEALTRSDAPAKVRFAEVNSREANIAAIYDEMLKRRRSFSAAFAAYKATGRPASEFQYDWFNYLLGLSEQIAAEKDLLLRQFLLFSYLDLGYGAYGAKLDAALARKALEEIPPASSLWSLEPDLIGIALRNVGRQDKYSGYVGQVIQKHPDQRVRDLVKKQLDPNRNIMVSKPVPAFSLPSLNDPKTTYTSEGLRGKVYLIDFWATWCKPCVEEMENMHRAHEKYKASGFEILSLSLDDKPETVSRFRRGRWKMPWLNAFIVNGFDSPLVKQFEISGIPRPVLVDRDVKIIATENELRGPNLDRTLSRVLGGSTRQVIGRGRLHARTDWRVQPSFMLDTICFLNVLTGDPFYVRYYKNDYARFEPQLTPAARAALAGLKRKIKDEKKNIVSAFLALYFSATDDRTLDDLLDTVKDSEGMKKNLKRTTYYNEPGWQLYESVREDLRVVLLFLKEIQFERYWRQNILPKVEAKIAAIRKDLPRYNVICEVERLLGSRLPSSELTVYILNYSQPHGIRVTGPRFLTDAAYPFEIVLRNAVHELMHPPYDLGSDHELKEALDLLREDAFLMDKVNNHNPSFGYNSFEGFVEEDCVQALEQIINEKLGLEVEAHRRWKENDDGMHVFAVALYSSMKEENFTGGRETFRDFLIRSIRSGRLKSGSIRASYDSFYSQHR